MTVITGTPSNIEFGPCQVTFNAVDLGFFKGGVVFNYSVTFYDIRVDQSTMPVETRVSQESAMATVPMAETDLATLSTVMVTGTYVLDSGGAKKKISFGGKQISVADNGAELIITPISDGSGTLTTDDNEIITIYSAIAKMPSFEKTYNLDGERVVPVEFHAFRDSTKDAGEQFFLMGDSTATA